MKTALRLAATILNLVVVNSFMVAVAAQLTTVRNSALSVPTATLVSAGLPGVTNFAGSNLQVSAVQADTLQGGQADIRNFEQWSQSYGFTSPFPESAAYAIATRPDGSVVITGPSNGSNGTPDFATICYASNGTPLWTNRYDGTGQRYDYARFLAVDLNGNVWVTGESMRYATNYTLTDVVTIKYASNGVPAWTNRYSSFETNGAYPTGLVVDNAGNAYLSAWGTYWVGFSGTPVEDALIKYDADGNVAWSKHAFSASHNSVQGLAGFGPMALDGAGNLFVANGSTVVAFSGDGSAIQTNLFSRQTLADLDLLSVDSEGMAIVTGSGWSSNSTLYVVIKLAPNGGPLWINELPGPGYNGGNVPITLIDPAGNILLIGGAPGTMPGLYHILKISGVGIPLWTNQTAIFGTTNGMVQDAALDQAGNLYLAGSAPAVSGGRDFVTFKFSAAGQFVWSNRFNGPANREDIPSALAVSSAGEVYVAGRSEGLNGRRDMVTIKYNDVLCYSPPQDFTGPDAITVSLMDPLGNLVTGAVDVLVAPGAFHFAPASGLTPSGMLLQLDGAPSTNVIVLEASADTVNWQRISTNTPSQGSVQFLDSTAANQPQRFYRVTQEQ
jgi:hypothetical protein